jgi:AraC family transcriptional regulator
MLEIEHSSGARLPQHSHVSAYLCLLLQGSYQETMGERTLVYRPCTLAFHPPALTHHDEIGPRGGRFFNVEIDPAHIASLTDSDLTAHMAPGEVFDPIAVGLILSLYREYRLLHEGDLAAHALHVESISIELVAASVRARTPAERRRPAWLTRVIEHLHDGRRESPTVVGLARDAAVHPVHLARVFRRIYGCTMGQYRARIRVQRACGLLMSCDLPLARIAADAGFADQSHLTRVFTSVVGCPPGMYRRLVG